MKVRTTAPLTNELGPIPIGTVLDDPECYQLMRMGKAEAADEEAAEVARFDELVAERQKKQKRDERAARTREALRKERENFCRKLGIDPAEAALPEPVVAKKYPPIEDVGGERLGSAPGIVLPPSVEPSSEK